MIDEKKLIEDIDNCVVGLTNIQIIKIAEIIEQQPKVGEWIPIGQYPTEPVLLCFEDGSQSVGYYEENDDVVICCGSDYVTTYDEPIAFKWLPEPYKEEVN